MLTGKSGERIVMCTEQNGHLLNLGMSGSGKSFYIYRRLEELWQAGAGGKRYAILDYSNSFTADEMDKAGFAIDGHIFHSDMAKESFTVFLGKVGVEDVGRLMQDILVDVFHVQGYRQKKILLDYCMDFAHSMGNEEERPLSDLYLKIEEDVAEEKIQEKDKYNETLKLLDRLEILERCKIQISRGAYMWAEGVHVIRLSDLSGNEKKIYANLLLRLFWYQVQHLKIGFFQYMSWTNFIIWICLSR